MAKRTFLLSENHLKLIKQLKFSLTEDKLNIISIEKNENDIDESHKLELTAFGVDKYEGMNLIIQGQPSNETFDLIKAEELYSFTEEQKDEMNKLMNELPTALEIVLSTQSFEVGEYCMKLHEGIWCKKIN